MHTNLVILLYLGSLFTWVKVFRVFRPLPNHVKEQRLKFISCIKKAESYYYVAVAVFKLSVACFHLGNFSCANAFLQVVVVAKVEDVANLTLQSCSFTS